jgi:hypothetical protein
LLDLLGRLKIEQQAVVGGREVDVARDQPCFAPARDRCAEVRLRGLEVRVARGAVDVSRITGIPQV